MDDDLKDYAEITLDRPRRIRFGWGGIRELSRRLGGASLVEITNKLGQADPEAITQALLVGMRDEPDMKRADPSKIDGILDGYFKKTGEDEGLGAVVGALVEAIQAHGVLRDKRKSSEPHTGNA